MTSRAVWKYPFRIENVIELDLPGGHLAQILSVQTQNGMPTLWALVNPNVAVSRVKLLCFGTGHPIDGDKIGAFIGTFQMYDGGLVFHIFWSKI